MNMKNKEHLLYFFLQDKISLSQYDYKFMANLQTIIQREQRVTTGQATLFDNLISKYKKQLTKLGLDKDELKALEWNATVVESTTEYTGASVFLVNDELRFRVPFNKTFISKFRDIEDNTFAWDKENKLYRTDFSTTAFKIITQTLHKFFPTVKYCEELSAILTSLAEIESGTTVWNPTLCMINERLVVAACNPVIGELIATTELALEPNILFKLNQMGIEIDQSILPDDDKLQFSANEVYEVELVDVEKVIGWMKNIGCENVVIGRGLRSTINQEQLVGMITKYGMKPLGPLSYGKLPDGVSMLMQHTSSVNNRNPFTGSVSKTVVLKDSRPIEVQ
jgi:hypothetical protein